MQISSMNSVNTAFYGRPHRAIPLSSLFNIQATNLQTAKENFLMKQASLGLGGSYSDVERLCREKLRELGGTSKKGSCELNIVIGNKEYRVDWYKPNGGCIRNIQRNTGMDGMLEVLKVGTKKWS